MLGGLSSVRVDYEQRPESVRLNYFIAVVDSKCKS